MRGDEYNKSTMAYTYDYPRPALTVDGVIFAVHPKQLQVLLIRRKHEPFRNCWALPGGFFDMEDDSVDHAAARELQEETGLVDLQLEQFYVFSKKGRDPRGRTVSVAYFAVVAAGSLSPVAADDAKEVAWHAVGSLPQLAFDHDEVIEKAVQSARARGQLVGPAV